MTQQEIRDALLAALRTVAPELDASAIAPAEPLRPQVDIDSIDFLRVLVEIKRTLGIDTPEVDYARTATLDDWVAYLMERLASAPAAARTGQ